MEGSDLKAMRQSAGMTQADMATSIGMARETIGAMERGTHAIELRTELAVRYVIGSRIRTPVSETPAVSEAPAPSDPLMRIAEALKPILDGWYRPKSE